MRKPDNLDWARYPHYIRTRRLEILRNVTAASCRLRPCSRKTCRRSGHCRDLAWVEVHIARPLAAAGDKPPSALDWKLLNALRQALIGPEKPA